MTAEQQGSDESGEGLRDLCAENGHWASGGFPDADNGNEHFVCECGLPWSLGAGCAFVQGAALLADRLAAVTSQRDDWHQVAEATIRTAEAALATARRDADELRAQAFIAGWFAHARNPQGLVVEDAWHAYRIGDLCPGCLQKPCACPVDDSAARDIFARAALANPSAAQGEGEVGK